MAFANMIICNGLWTRARIEQKSDRARTEPDQWCARGGTGRSGDQPPRHFNKNPERHVQCKNYFGSAFNNFREPKFQHISGQLGGGRGRGGDLPPRAYHWARPDRTRPGFIFHFRDPWGSEAPITTPKSLGRGKKKKEHFNMDFLISYRI